MAVQNVTIPSSFVVVVVVVYPGRLHGGLVGAWCVSFRVPHRCAAIQ